MNNNYTNNTMDAYMQFGSLFYKVDVPEILYYIDISVDIIYNIVNLYYGF
jgi:hypothetical protein